MRSLIRNILPVLPVALCYNMPVLYDDWMRLMSKILPILSACQSESSSVVFMSSISRCTDMYEVCNWAEKYPLLETLSLSICSCCTSFGHQSKPLKDLPLYSGMIIRIYQAPLYFTPMLYH